MTRAGISMDDPLQRKYRPQEKDSFGQIEALLSDSRQIMEALKTAVQEHCEERFKKELCRYIQCRYMLNKLPQMSDELYELADMSLKRMSGLPAPNRERLEASSGCTGAKSAMIKKVLLILSLMRELCTNISEDEALKADTVEQLANLCWKHI